MNRLKSKKGERVKIIKLSDNHKGILKQQQEAINNLKMRIADLELEKDHSKMKLMGTVEHINKLIQSFPDVYNIPADSKLYINEGYFECPEKEEE
jgi:hypothetical protein